ncbi:MAG: cytochrome P450 [Brevibacterium sp.]
MNARKALRKDEAAEPSVERELIGEGPAAIWRIRSFAAARAVLRARTGTSQAGFTAERIPRGVFRRHPILISDGPAHDAQRRDLARFFAPAVVADRYGDFIAARAEAAVERIIRQGRCRLDEVALHFAVDVTAEVVGLTESSVTGMARRLEGFFTQPPVDLAAPNWGRTRLQWLQAAINGLVPIGRFYLADVRPAVRARRRGRVSSRVGASGHEHGGDVLTHLIESGHSTSDILVECVTYGTAGMVTTREFISMACWHLLSDADLGAEYGRAEQPRRLEILKEIIRLEPVVGHLYRRAQDEVEIADGGSTHTIARGDLIDVCVRATNTDHAAFDPTNSGRDDTESGGDSSDPHFLCPARHTADGVPAVGMSFSDGAHSCPGQPLALLETDALLHRLLAHRPRILHEPTIGWDSVIAGYRIRGLELAFDHGHGTEREEPDYGEPAEHGEPT